MKSYGILAVLVFVLAACATAAPPSTPPVSPIAPTASVPPLSPVATPLSPDEPVIIYERTGGIAGVMEKWQFYADGRVEIQSRATTSTAQLAPEAVADALKRIEDSGFYTLDDSYLPANRCCDLFTYRLTVGQGASRKTVTTMDGAEQPEALTESLAIVNDLIGLIQH